MRALRLIGFSVLLLLVLSTGVQAATLLVDPDPIAIPSGMSADVVHKEIKRALVVRGWVISSEQPDQIHATLNLRAHVARIAISHGSGTVSVSYVSSENLDFKEKKGKRYIHKNYRSWVNNVLTDISRNLQLVTLE